MNDGKRASLEVVNVHNQPSWISKSSGNITSPDMSGLQRTCCNLWDIYLSYQLGKVFHIQNPRILSTGQKNEKKHDKEMKNK